MLLALDIGNSQTSFGVFDGETLLHHWRAETKVSRTADEFASLLFPLLDHAGLRSAKWDGIAVSSVVPPAEFAFDIFCREYLKSTVFKIHCGLPLGIKINVAVPDEVGADRLVNAAYAVRCMKLPAIVVDFGTATTFDIVSSQRVYEGGVILPGVKMGVEALSTKTSKLPLIGLHFPKSVIGKSTVECIQSGMLHGYAEMIDGLIRKIERELGVQCDVALTGGLANLFHQRLSKPALLLPNLTLEAIAFLYRQNRNK